MLLFVAHVASCLNVAEGNKQTAKKMQDTNIGSEFNHIETEM